MINPVTGRIWAVSFKLQSFYPRHPTDSRPSGLQSRSERDKLPYNFRESNLGPLGRRQNSKEEKCIIASQEVNSLKAWQKDKIKNTHCSIIVRKADPLRPFLVLSILGSNEGSLLRWLERTARKAIIYYMMRVISSGIENRTSFWHQALLNDFHTLARAYHPSPQFCTSICPSASETLFYF